MLVRRLEYAAVLILLLLFYIFFVDYLSFFLLVFFAAIPLVSLLLTGLQLLTFAVGLGQQEKVFVAAGETFNIPLTTTRAPLLGGLEIRIRVKVENVLMQTMEQSNYRFTPEQKRKNEEPKSIQITTGECGRYLMTLVDARCYDYLKLFSLRVKKDVKVREVTVIPEIEENQSRMELGDRMDPDAQRYAEGKPGDDYTELFDLREYQPGDRVSRIHWKLYGRRGEIIVREGSYPIDSRFIIAVDLKPAYANHKAAEELFGAAFSLSQELVAENLPHEMLWWDARTDFAMEAKIDGEESYFHALYEAMGTRIPDDRLHLITTLAEEKHAATLVYFTRDFTGPEREILLENMEDITLVIEEVEEKKG